MTSPQLPDAKEEITWKDNYGRRFCTTLRLNLFEGIIPFDDFLCVQKETSQCSIIGWLCISTVCFIHFFSAELYNRQQSRFLILNCIAQLANNHRCVSVCVSINHNVRTNSSLYEEETDVQNHKKGTLDGKFLT